MDKLVQTIREKYLQTLDAIATAARSAGHDPGSVKLVVVTKTQPLEIVRAAIEAGVTILGENYPEEGVTKIQSLREFSAVEWHMIGHVQSRKAQLVPGNFNLLHSLDGVKLAARLDRYCGEAKCKLPVLLEFNVGGEESKSGWPGGDEPHCFYDAAGNRINRSEFDRDLLDARLQVALVRWGLLEAGLGIGRVRTREQAGLDLPDATDETRLLHAAATFDTLDDLFWPDAGGRLALQAAWNASGLGATRPYWRFDAEARLGRSLSERVALQVDGRLGLSGDDLPVYDHFRLGGPFLDPGYHFEELKGPQTLAGSLSLRLHLIGALRVYARAGAGNVFATRDAIGLDDLRWGIGFGALYPSRVGPLALDVGIRDGGDTLVSVMLGWN